jgi:hypothetical protein
MSSMLKIRTKEVADQKKKEVDALYERRSRLSKVLQRKRKLPVLR